LKRFRRGRRITRANHAKGELDWTPQMKTKKKPVGRGESTERRCRWSRGPCSVEEFEADMVDTMKPAATARLKEVENELGLGRKLKRRGRRRCGVPGVL